MNRWNEFRTYEEEIPSTPYEACVFIANARLHLSAYGFSSFEARQVLTEAYCQINAESFSPSKEAA